jgi:hypothetical protein
MKLLTQANFVVLNDIASPKENHPKVVLMFLGGPDAIDQGPGCLELYLQFFLSIKSDSLVILVSAAAIASLALL